MNRKVFVILINYNAYRETVDCVVSLKNQTYSNLGIVIVDNCSSNDSLDVLERECSDCKIIRSSTNTGFSGGNNLGAAFAIENGAECLVFLNNDTELEPDCIELLVNEMGDNDCICPQILYYSDRNVINSRGGYFSKKLGCGVNTNRLKPFDQTITERERITLAYGCCIALTVNTYKRLGPWREDYFLYREDDEYTLRMINSGVKIYLEPKAIVYHKENMSTGKDTGAAIRNYYCFRNRLYNVKHYKLGLFTYCRILLAIIIKYLGFKFAGKNEYKYLWKALKDYQSGRVGPME